MIGTLVTGGFLSFLIGLTLGALGGGGSILAVPVLVYVLGLEAKSAIATSLFVIGATSAAATLAHARAGRVAWRIGLSFGLAGVAGGFAGGQAARHVPGGLLLLALAAVMLATAGAMLRGGGEPEQAPGRRSSGSTLRWTAQGALVGFITGLVGAGGGFLVVPALVILGGLPMRIAVGTSLLVITMNSLSAFLVHAGHADIDWRLAAVAAAASIAGSLGGGGLAALVPARTLRKTFAWLVVGVGVFMLSRQLSSVLEDAGVGRVPWRGLALSLVVLIAVLVGLLGRAPPGGLLKRNGTR